MFEFEHHRKVLIVLNNLYAGFFAESRAYFGGGTLLALLYDEYRWSKDIDFICPVGEGYKSLRGAVLNHGYDALFASYDEIEVPRDIKADQYGIRFAVVADGTAIKFKIIAEGRINLTSPAYYDWCPVPCLSFDDTCSEKLLSNADRWNDASIESRDLIDLAILRQQSPISESAFRKANDAYDVIAPLEKAIHKFESQAEYREKCFTALAVGAKAEILQGVALLKSDIKSGNIYPPP